MSFPCSGCGACCRRVDKAVKASEGIDEFIFPYNWDGSGKCEMLGEDNKCMVYEDRPFLCRVDEIAEYLGIDKEEWHKINAKACNEMMDQDQIEIKYRINL
jgi:uncharacterized protein